MHENTTTVEISNVTVASLGRTLFRDFNLTLHKGEHWVVQGRNGSGKTFLLQLIAGAHTPLHGTVTHSFINGHNWDSRYRQRQEQIHFIPTHWIQSALGGFSDLFYQQRYYAIEETELPKVSDIFGDDLGALEDLSFSNNFDIRRLFDLHITRLSNGQLKKVIILRQLARNIPKLLILDYPFDGLDAESRDDLCLFIDEIATRYDIQVILTDHGDSLPTVINRRLTLDHFAIRKQEHVKITRTPSLPRPVSHRPATTNGRAVVEMQDLTISYSGKEIISGLSWRVNQGERWALTGKNGSGKTTLFSLIFADHPMAYSQKVFLFGKRRGSGESIWDIKNRINYLGPEQTHFLDHQTRSLSARAYISRHADLQPERLAELIGSFDAEEYLDLPLHSLSSGQLQMVLLMDMFLHDKELLLLDEPFQFLDPGNHSKVTKYLNQFLHEDITLILITHDERDVTQWTQLRKVL